MTQTAATPSTGFLRVSGDFYVTGGTLRPDAPSYIERQADKDLCAGLLKGEFCYVLTPRQMGKSSLMVRTVRRLRQDGAAVAVLDLTAIGQNLTIAQWYDGLVSRLGQQLHLEDEVLDYCEAHPEFGPLQRWVHVVEQIVLKHTQRQIVIFVDEIDIVRSLPFSTDEFFAAIREFHNRRSREPEFNRLSFGLLGVATPTDLIRDTRMTPFNIGRRIELNDFTPEEAAPLASGLGPDEETAAALLSRVLYWTGGHPYLTQRLCRAMADQIQQEPTEPPPLSGPAPPVIPSVADVDAMANKLFLSRQARDRDDNLIFVRERILRSEVDVAGLLYLYRRIRGGARVADDETNPQISVLRLSGIIRGVGGVLEVRNRIYGHVFDQGWAATNMPFAEVRRQRRAGRRGVLIGLGIAVVLVAAYLLVGPVIRERRQAFLAQTTLQKLYANYQDAQYYQGSFDATYEIGVGGTVAPVRGSGTLYYQAPGRMNLVIKSALTSPETEIRVVCDGKVRSIYAPAIEQFRVDPVLPPLPPPAPDQKLGREAVTPWLHAPAPPGHPRLPENPAPQCLAIPRAVEQQIAPAHIMPLFRMLFLPSTAETFLRDAEQIAYGGEAELDGQRTLILRWQHAAGAFLESLGVPRALTGKETIPVTAWVSRANGLVLQLRVDLSPWAAQLSGDSDVPITGLVITEHHRAVIRSEDAQELEGRFVFKPPAGARRVAQLELPRPDFAAMATAKREVLRSIPSRSSLAPPELIDLSGYYNASFTAPWHPGPNGNTLEQLPTGLLQFGGVTFDVRGIVQLSSKKLADPAYPKRINGIAVEQSCRRLHFLHAAGWNQPDGTRVGSYVITYTDGQEQEVPIVYGKDLRDWNAETDRGSLSSANVVWTGMNWAKFRVRLFKATWENPRPEIEVQSLDFVSAGNDAAPFLIAITAEP